MNHPITTLPTGYFMPGLKGTARFERHKTVYLGTECLRVELPTYLVRIDGSKTERGDCQAGRDFTFDPD
jgi:hypothetical protein